MATWAEFERDAPALFSRGAEILFGFGIGLGYLATVRADGGPRVHPVCPIAHEGHLYVLVGRSPKQADLRRDARFALHSFPRERRPRRSPSSDGRSVPLRNRRTRAG